MLPMRPNPARAVLVPFVVAVVAASIGCTAMPTSGTGTSADNAAGGAAVRVSPLEAALAAAPPSQPVDLLGFWHVVPADSTAAETWMQLDYGRVALGTECGPITGSLALSGHEMMANAPDYVYPECGGGANWRPAEWLGASFAFRGTTTGGFELLDRDGTVTATLTEGTAADVSPEVWEGYQRVPEITEEIREWLTPAVALPEGSDAAEDIIGRWVLAGEANTAGRAYVEFRSDGSFRGSDGCNGVGGRWRLAADGRIITTHDPSTLIACANPSIPLLFTGSIAQGATDGPTDELVLYGKDGVEQATLVRD